MDQPLAATIRPQNRGETPLVGPDRSALDISALRAELLAPAGPLARLEWTERTGSSNDDLAALAQPATAEASRQAHAQWPDLSVLTAEVQTAGKGRLGRGWVAPAGATLAVSVLLRPYELPREQYGWLSMIGALAVCRVLREHGLAAAIKWPNDVLLVQANQQRKVCGILAQLLSPAAIGFPPAVVLGIGLNVSQRRQELPVEHATSLTLAGCAGLSRERLLAQILRGFAGDYVRFTGAPGSGFVPPLSEALSGTDEVELQRTRVELRREISAALATLGQPVRAELPGQRFVEGVAVGLDAGGGLLIEDAEGHTSAISAADVVHLRPEAAFGAVYA